MISFLNFSLRAFLLFSVAAALECNAYWTEQDNSLGNVTNKCVEINNKKDVALASLEGKWHIPYISVQWLSTLGLSFFNEPSDSAEYPLAICPFVEILATNEKELQMSWKSPAVEKSTSYSCRSVETSGKDFHCYSSRADDTQSTSLNMMILGANLESWMILATGIFSPEELSIDSRLAILTKTEHLDLTSKIDIIEFMLKLGLDRKEIFGKIRFDSICGHNLAGSSSSFVDMLLEAANTIEQLEDKDDAEKKNMINQFFWSKMESFSSLFNFDNLPSANVLPGAMGSPVPDDSDSSSGEDSNDSSGEKSAEEKKQDNPSEDNPLEGFSKIPVIGPLSEAFLQQGKKLMTLGFP